VAANIKYSYVNYVGIDDEVKVKMKTVDKFLITSVTS